MLVLWEHADVPGICSVDVFITPVSVDSRDRLPSLTFFSLCLFCSYAHLSALMDNLMGTAAAWVPSGGGASRCVCVTVFLCCFRCVCVSVRESVCRCVSVPALSRDFITVPTSAQYTFSRLELLLLLVPLMKGRFRFSQAYRTYHYTAPTKRKNGRRIKEGRLPSKIILLFFCVPENHTSEK